ILRERATRRRDPSPFILPWARVYLCNRAPPWPQPHRLAAASACAVCYTGAEGLQSNQGGAVMRSFLSSCVITALLGINVLLFYGGVFWNGVLYRQALPQRSDELPPITHWERERLLGQLRTRTHVVWAIGLALAAPLLAMTAFALFLAL